MIEYSYKYSNKSEERKPVNESIEFYDGRGRYDMGFNVWHGDAHVVSIRGATAQDMLAAFLRNASTHHLYYFKRGLEDELKWRKGDD